RRGGLFGGGHFPRWTRPPRMHSIILLQRQTAKDSAVRGESQWLFKEWAAVCAAIAAGRQTVLLRKGGIQERDTIFEPDHRAFWLLPTRFHQSPEELTPDATEWIARG